ncbi:hypothetical protein PLESTB_001745500 [Pleodorina starrii]|uniref:Uncharacterized protein n=1 Tax=Pleodorina starrii TaxID=330485 RepID=A0A9W6C0P1_9CHLO|nr:hypothetical protein PLESTM_001673800 [Pleodorina starrii]GLC61342.1 hypothetical protein PLESTB_001745500 [Pleodorina starrii]GLC69347.1 hypothetical protein PLESTF_000819400 [Pleodorina starrii]
MTTVMRTEEPRRVAPVCVPALRWEEDGGERRKEEEGGGQRRAVLADGNRGGMGWDSPTGRGTRKLKVVGAALQLQDALRCAARALVVVRVGAERQPEAVWEEDTGVDGC